MSGAYLQVRDQQRASQVAKGSVTAGPEVERAWIGLGRCNQVGDRPEARLGVHHNDLRDHIGSEDRREVALQIVRQILLEAGEDEVSGRDLQDRVTVRFGSGRYLRANRSAAAGPVFNEDGLSQVGAHPLGKDPRHEIAGSPGFEGDDQLDRLRWERLGLSSNTWAGKKGCREGQSERGFPEGDHEVT
jgi:hypothetical protein